MYLVLFLVCFVSRAIAQDFRIVLGSCYRIQEIDDSPRLAGVWDEIRKRSPNAFIWGGDNVYGDYATGGAPAGREVLEDLYNRTRDLDKYKQFVASIGQENVIGTWDDHDFGLNNAGKDNPVKEEAQQALLDFFLVPKDDPRRSREGVYSSHYFANSRIKVILLDIRYHRDTGRDKSGDFLGEEQWSWLESELNDNLLETVRATIVVSGIQILPQDGLKTAPVEIWGDFPDAKERLLQTIAKSRAPNVVLVSGDVHHSEISAVRVRRDGEEGEYLIPEMTTSGMTHSIQDSIGFILTKGMELAYTVNPFSYQYDKLFLIDNNFGEMDFFFEEDELTEVTFRVFTSRGTLKIETSFAAAQLQDRTLGSVEDANIEPINDVSGFKRFFFYLVTIGIVVATVLSIICGGIGVLDCTFVLAGRAYLYTQAKYRSRRVSYESSQENVTL